MHNFHFVLKKVGEEAVCWGKAIQPYSWRPFLRTCPIHLYGDAVKSAMAQQVSCGTYIRAFSVELCDQSILDGRLQRFWRQNKKKWTGHSYFWPVLVSAAPCIKYDETHALKIWFWKHDSEIFGVHLYRVCGKTSATHHWDKDMHFLHVQEM